MAEGRGRDLEGRDLQGRHRRPNLRLAPSSGAASAPAKTSGTRAQAWKRAKVSMRAELARERVNATSVRRDRKMKRDDHDRVLNVARLLRVVWLCRSRTP